MFNFVLNSLLGHQVPSLFLTILTVSLIYHNSTQQVIVEILPQIQMPTNPRTGSTVNQADHPIHV